jgi:CDP-diacylglycerol--serine O-phosphatidyltransferase
MPTKGKARTVRKIAIIPTLLTLGNAVCGFAAIAYASKIDQTEGTEYYFALSGWLIFAAMVFDALDGYVARLARSTSKFGAELDSLCDAVSFGAAPAFLLMRMGPGWDRPMRMHEALAAIATLFMVCALLRLARYNVESLADPGASKRFRGLPSPAAAGCLASLAILRGSLAENWIGFDTAFIRGLVEVWATLGAFVVALLMVSRVPYPHLTKSILGGLKGRRHFSHLIELLVVGFVIVVFRQFSLVLVFWLYALAFLIRYAVIRALRPESQAYPAVSGIDDALKH